jgi:DNA polymerase-1
MKIEPVKTTETGQGATHEEALRRLDIPGLDLILSIRKLSKIKNTYLGAFIREQFNGFIHPSFNLHNVRTYRSSSEGPNFQNIPKRDKESMKICRRAILPRPGHMLVEADFSALEVNISECYHKDPVMMNYLLDPKSDMHLDMAKQIFIMPDMQKSIPAHAVMRQAAKNGFVFPQFYGDYYGNNAHSLCEWTKLPRGRWKRGQGLELPDGSHISNHFLSKGIKSFDQFTEHMKKVEDDFWNRRFKEYGRWKKKSIQDYRKRGWLKTHTGFTCSGLMRDNEISNYPIQGSAFHCLLFTFIELDKIAQREKWKSKIVGQIHDSILLDADPAELGRIKEALQTIVKEILPNAWKWIIVPLEIDVEEYGVDLPWVS